jgi:hypothetical protein
MMNSKTLIILTILFNFFIVIGAGHGIGFLILIEFSWLFDGFGIGTEEFNLYFSASYAKSWCSSSFFIVGATTYYFLPIHE